MRVPAYVKAAMRNVAKYSSRSDEEMRKVESWMDKVGINHEDMRDGSGHGLEELQYGNDITDIICSKIENGEFV